MAPFATLHTLTTIVHAKVTKSLAAAALNDLEIIIPSNFVYGTTNKSPEYLAKFPHGKIPALETPSGFYLAESTAIAYYIAESGPAKDQLLGRSVEERALVQMWTALSDQEIFPAAIAISEPVFGRARYIPTIVNPKEESFVRALNLVESRLAQEGRVWLVRDDEFSLADLSVASSLYWPLKNFMDEEYRKRFPKVMEWWERLMGVAKVGKAFEAPISFCKERRVPEEVYDVVRKE